MSITDDLKTAQVILINISKEKYSDSLRQIIPAIDVMGEKLGYVTINKPYNSILNDISGLGLKGEKYFFIDAITSTVQAPPIVDNCVFVSSPAALTEMGMAYSSVLSEQGCDLVFFDTISTLIVYQDIGSVIKFVHNLVTKARVQNKKLILLALKEDSESLIKDLNMFVDKVIEA